MPPCRRSPAVEKKALLIGISYDHNKVGREWGTIPTSIPNVRRIAAFLREHCGYTDIVIMTDEDGVEEIYRPTRHNLEREITALCRGVKPGDRRFFYYAGHSGQLPCPTGSEEDEQDETVVTVDGNEIRDNMLHKWLVKPLPNGSALTAIFDSCNSGTLLDLGHYKCNNVYRPWVNKGKRRSKTLQNCAVRKNCKATGSGPPSRHNSRPWIGSGEADAQFPSLIQVIQDKCPTAEPEQMVKESDNHHGERCASPEPEEHDRERRAPLQRTRHDGERCMSPERKFKCEGWCRDKNRLSRMTTFEHPDVISISSSNDGQTSWDASTRNGDSISMTTSLIDILEQYPRITYSQLMARLNNEVHSFTRNMHRRVRKQRRARRIAGGNSVDPEDAEPDGEMDNFQELQLGSLSPVDMDQLFVL